MKSVKQRRHVLCWQIKQLSAYLSDPQIPKYLRRNAVKGIAMTGTIQAIMGWMREAQQITPNRSDRRPILYTFSEVHSLNNLNRKARSTTKNVYKIGRRSELFLPLAPSVQ